MDAATRVCERQVLWPSLLPPPLPFLASLSLSGLPLHIFHFPRLHYGPPAPQATAAEQVAPRPRPKGQLNRTVLRVPGPPHHVRELQLQGSCESKTHEVRVRGRRDSTPRLQSTKREDSGQTTATDFLATVRLPEVRSRPRSRTILPRQESKATMEIQSDFRRVQGEGRGRALGRKVTTSRSLNTEIR